jgi:hypothetical protein
MDAEAGVALDFAFAIDVDDLTIIARPGGRRVYPAVGAGGAPAWIRRGKRVGATG